VVDAGAREALVKRNKSLLPAGIVSVEGAFQTGDLVSLVCGEREFARGVVDFSADEVVRIRGKQSAQAAKELGHPLCHEVVHRDNLVIL
jgi:glutamate 5-kinase